jgi:hypothetical protein
MLGRLFSVGCTVHVKLAVRFLFFGWHSKKNYDLVISFIMCSFSIRISIRIMNRINNGILQFDFKLKISGKQPFSKFGSILQIIWELNN